MAAKPEKTSVPGVYRRGGRYAVAYRDATGRQRWESARTFDEARRMKSGVALDPFVGVVVQGHARLPVELAARHVGVAGRAPANVVSARRRAPSTGRRSTGTRSSTSPRV